MICRTHDRHRKPQRKKQELKPFKFGPDGDMYQAKSGLEQDFRVSFHDDILRGEYFGYTQKSYVYLVRHECVEDIINTCIHESLHHCLANVGYGDEDSEGIQMEIHEEHWAIRQMAYANESMINEFDLFRNEALREEVEFTNDDLYPVDDENE